MTIFNFEYFLVLGLCFAIPFGFIVIHRRVVAKDGIRIINPSVLIAAVPFLIWDVLAIKAGWWDFNPKYTLGIRIGNLPVEEVAFFSLIPQACLLLWWGMNRFNNPGEVIETLKDHNSDRISHIPFFGSVIDSQREHKVVFGRYLHARRPPGKNRSSAQAPPKGIMQKSLSLKKK